MSEQEKGKKPQNAKNGLTRREIVTSITIGGVITAVSLPAQWKKPLVDAIITPAHAQATAPGTTTTPPPPTTAPLTTVGTTMSATTTTTTTTTTIPLTTTMAPITTLSI